MPNAEVVDPAVASAPKAEGVVVLVEPNADGVVVEPNADGVVVDVLPNAEEVEGNAVVPEPPAPKTEGVD